MSGAADTHRLGASAGWQLHHSPFDEWAGSWDDLPERYPQDSVQGYVHRGPVGTQGKPGPKQFRVEIRQRENPARVGVPRRNGQARFLGPDRPVF